MHGIQRHVKNQRSISRIYYGAEEEGNLNSSIHRDGRSHWRVNGVLGHILWLESGCWRAIQDELVDLTELTSIVSRPKRYKSHRNSSHSTHENNGDI